MALGSEKNGRATRNRSIRGSYSTSSGPPDTIHQILVKSLSPFPSSTGKAVPFPAHIRFFMLISRPLLVDRLYRLPVPLTGVSVPTTASRITSLVTGMRFRPPKHQAPGAKFDVYFSLASSLQPSHARPAPQKKHHLTVSTLTPLLQNFCQQHLDLFQLLAHAPIAISTPH